jgi:hypothetical protein
VERADRYAAPDTAARVWANIGSGELKNQVGLSTRRFDLATEGCRLLIQNLDLARRVGEPESFSFAALARIAQAVRAPTYNSRVLDSAPQGVLL